MYYSDFHGTPCIPSDQKFYENNKLNPQKRNYNRKIRGRNQPVPQESENKSPAKRANKKSSQFDLNQTFISYSPQKKNYKNIKKHTDQLNNNINCYQENIPESPEVTPLVSQESPQSSYHNIPESFPSFRLPTAYPKVELTRSSTPSSDEQADSSFFRNHFEEEDIFMYAAWKKEVEAPYFVINHNGKRRGPPERINDTLIGNISPKNFPQFTYIDPQASHPKQVPKLAPTVFIRQYYYPLYTPPHLMPQVHQMHPNIMEFCNPYLNPPMPLPSQFMSSATSNPYYPVIMKQFTQYQYPSAPQMHQPRHPGQPTVIEQHQFVPVPSPYPGATPNYFY